MNTVDIFGSCFTRELFNYTQDYKVKTYLLQQSIYTMNAEPYPISKGDIKTPDDFKFKNRMVYYDFNKIAFSVLASHPAEYLVIDLADQARDILILNSNPKVKLISSSAIKYNLKRLNEDFSVQHIEDLSDDDIQKHINEFANIILSLYDPKKIILNKVQMQSYYYDNGRMKNINNDVSILQKKDQIERVEKLFLNAFPDCKCLFTNHEPVLNINHKFGGPHPMHFEDIYYNYRMKLLDALINKIDNNKIENDYDIEYNNTINDIRKKVLKK